MPTRPPLRKPAAAPRKKAKSASKVVRWPIVDPVIALNAAGIIQTANESVRAVFGWKAAELIGLSVDTIVAGPRKASLQRCLTRVGHAAELPSSRRYRRFAGLHKKGTAFPIELTLLRPELCTRASTLFLAIIHDKPDRGFVIRAGVDGRTRYQKLIEQQTRALATADLRLHAADRLISLGTLAAGLGHDVNNVLLPVRARLNAIEHSGLTAVTRAHLVAVRSSIDYLQQISDGLRLLSRDPEQAASAAEVTRTNLSSWWCQVGVLLRRAVPMHVRVEASLPAGLPVVRIAPHWLTHAMLNLMVNAGEAIPEARRGALVRIVAAETSDGRAVRVGVTDNGHGMSASVRRRAFDLFFSTKPGRTNGGLGLPLARQALMRAGGSLEIESKSGRGTSAVLILPVEASTGRAVHS